MTPERPKARVLKPSERYHVPVAVTPKLPPTPPKPPVDDDKQERWTTEEE